MRIPIIYSGPFANVDNAWFKKPGTIQHIYGPGFRVKVFYDAILFWKIRELEDFLKINELTYIHLN